MKNIFIVNKAILFKTLGIFVVYLMLTSCGSGSSGSPETVVVSGTITYDSVPITEGGLDYTAIVEKPIRRSLINAIDASNNSILEVTYSDDDGLYSFSVPASKNIKINVYSQSQNPLIRIQDNAGGLFPGGEFARFVMQSEAFATTVGVNVEKNLNADSGYTSPTQVLSNERVAAPFAILDACLKSADFFLENRSTIIFPKLVVNWSEQNSSAAIGTSHWSGTELNILGDADVDTDEYDQHVIVHEWGHYFEAVLGRSDSVGGPHTDGDILDPRVAFSEGWGNALSAMVLYPDSVYKDSGGANQATTGIKFDVDENNGELTKDPAFKIGWHSENSVQSILYDLFDPVTDDAGESWDLVSTNSGAIYDAFTNEVRESESLVTIFTFINAFLTRNPSSATDVNTLLAKHSIDPIVDAFGSGETNNGGLTDSLPIYKSLALGDSVILNFEPNSGSTNTNFLEDMQYVVISGVSGNADIVASGSSSKTVTIYSKGVVLEGKDASGSSSVSILNFNFDSSKTYILVISNDNKVSTQITVSLNP